jgi:hypothetical protein
MSFIMLNLSYPSLLFAVHEDTSHESRLALPEEKVPYDIPIEEVEPFLGPRNELQLFPCSDCHDEDWETDFTRRELDEPHNEIPGKFVNHDSENRWCLDCHSPNNRDKLRLLNGTLIDFDKYYKVCAQCHKKIFRQWKAGVHGKRTGYWNGEKIYYQCTACHNPHNPPFKPLKPMPAPRKPANVRVSAEK